MTEIVIFCWTCDKILDDGLVSPHDSLLIDTHLISVHKGHQVGLRYAFNVPEWCKKLEQKTGQKTITQDGKT